MASLREHPEWGRYVQAHGPILKRLRLAYVLTNLIVICLFGWQYYDTQQQCRQGSLNREAIRASIIEGLPGLGARYDTELGVVVPDRSEILVYYKTHEKERLRILSGQIKALERFPSIECDNDYIPIL